MSEVLPQQRELTQILSLTSWHRLKLIELPLAFRSIMAGIKTSATINVGMATLAAFIGSGGYGALISTGLALDDTSIGNGQ